MPGVKGSDRDPEKTCTVEGCNGWEYESLEFCWHHRGLAEGPKSDNGAPEGNENARTHGYYVEPDKFYEGLSDKKQQLVDDIEGDLIERYKEYHGREPDRADKEDFYELGIGYAKRRSMRDYQIAQAADSGNPLLELREKDGETFKVPSSVEEIITDSRRENRLERQTKGLEKDPESQKANATEELANLWAEDLS
jgi:hypothetical protein